MAVTGGNMAWSQGTVNAKKGVNCENIQALNIKAGNDRQKLSQESSKVRLLFSSTVQRKFSTFEPKTVSETSAIWILLLRQTPSVARGLDHGFP